MVSVCCLVFNHAKYLRKCLDGFVMQQTDFDFEVLINDDASTDGSQEILREYERKYPKIIKPIYQRENQYSKGVKVSVTFNYPRIKGKYVAYCEGDDYWSDPHKLQKQFDIMEKNPSCTMCAHKVLDINENGTLKRTTKPCRNWLKGGAYSGGEILDFLYVDYGFQTSSFFIRHDILAKFSLYPQIRNGFDVGDLALILWCAANGNIYYIDSIMSHYRVLSVGSWSIRTKQNSAAFTEKRKSNAKGYAAFNEYTDFKYKEKIDKLLLALDFQLELLNGNYASVLAKKYRVLFKYKLDFRGRLKCIIYALLPKKAVGFVLSLLRKLIGKA